MEQKIRKIGNSYGILIPAEVIKKLKLKLNQKVYLSLYEDEKTLVVGTKKNLAGNVSPQFIKLINELNERYKDVFQELARR